MAGKRGTKVFQDSDADAIRSLYESGMSQMAIAKKYGCDERTVRIFMQKHGIEARHQNLTKGKIRVYLKIGPPPYCLPEMVADSYKELAEMDNVRPESIIRRIYMQKNGSVKREKYCAVVIDMEE